MAIYYIKANPVLVAPSWQRAYIMNLEAKIILAYIHIDLYEKWLLNRN